MEFINEFGLLIAVATPVGVIALINVLLAMGGERGTLLLPSLRSYPAVLEPQAPITAKMQAAKPEAARPVRKPVVAGYDEADELLVRQAA